MKWVYSAMLYLHPDARVKDNLLFYGLVDAIKEISTIDNALNST